METKEHKKHDEKTEKDSDRKSLITVLVIVGAVILLFIAAYFITGYIKDYQEKKELEKNTFVYNNYTFTKRDDGYWYAKFYIDAVPYELPFYYTPQELENITIDNQNTITKIQKFGDIAKKNIYISVDPDENVKIVIAKVEIDKILKQVYNYNVQSALAHNLSYPVDYPIITCKNQTGSVMVIWLTPGDENRISSLDYCIMLEYKSVNESVMVADALAYRLLNIMK